MKCSRVQDILIDYLAGELGLREQELVREHLALCEACRAQLAPARRALDGLSMLRGDEPAPELLGAVKERLAREQAARHSRLGLRLAWACALVLVVVLAGSRLWREPAAKQISRAPQVAAPQVTPAPTASIAPKTRTEPRMAAKPRVRAVERRRLRPVRHPDPPAQQANANDPAVQPDESTEPEPMMIFALQPRKPEIYMIRVGEEEGRQAADVIVKREFDISGSLTSVTIDMEGPVTPADIESPSGASTPGDSPDGDSLQAGGFDTTGGNNHA
jgi:hypothetical protein